MHYQVGYLDVLTSMFSVLLVTFIILCCAVIACSTAKKLQSKYVVLMLFPGFWLLILVVSVIVFSQVGSGWTLQNDNHLKVKAWASRDIKITEAKVDLVDSRSPWQLTGKRKGYNTDDLNLGWFHLQNGKEAIVFQHLTSPKMLLILTNNEYIVLSHPGVETLYTELLNRGITRLAH